MGSVSQQESVGGEFLGLEPTCWVVHKNGKPLQQWSSEWVNKQKALGNFCPLSRPQFLHLQKENLLVIQFPSGINILWF